jgi:hypothetical protein
LRKSEIYAKGFPFAKTNRCEALAVRMGAGMAFETIYARPEAGSDFSIWIRRNPLKSPDSDEQNQANPSHFAWIYLEVFGVREGAFG